MKKIVILDDDRSTVDAVTIALSGSDFICIDSGSAGSLFTIGIDAPGLLVLDKLLGGAVGVDVVRGGNKSRNARKTSVTVISPALNFQRKTKDIPLMVVAGKLFRFRVMREKIARLVG